MDRSWMLEARTSDAYLSGIEQFLSFAVKNANKQRRKPVLIRCPCFECDNVPPGLSISEVRNHLVCTGFDPGYSKWFWHGEDCGFTSNVEDEDVVQCDEDVGEAEFLEDEDVEMVEGASDDLRSDPITFHVLMQELLPIAIRSVLPQKVRYVITRLCFFFKALCSKEVDVSKLDAIQKQLVETLCLFEKYFPPSFFDIMIHLTVHLVREVQLCGPVYFRWMYPFERFLKALKSNIRNKNRPEGCITANYIAQEAVRFYVEKFPGTPSVGIPLSGNIVTDGKPFPGGVVVEVEYQLWAQAHRTVLANTDEVQPYAERHLLLLKNKYPRKSRSPKWLYDKHNETFIAWLRETVEDELNDPKNCISKTLEWVAFGPCLQVFKYSGYSINGYRFHTNELDNKRVNQNSGVSIFASGMQVCSRKDTNPVFVPSTYYGVISEIWLLDYNVMMIPVFKCDWVDSAHGVRTDELGFKLVQLSRAGHKTDPFILASHAQQVFYVEDPLDSMFSVVLTMPTKEDPCIGSDNAKVSELPSVDARDEEPFVRVNCDGTWV